MISLTPTPPTEKLANVQNAANQYLNTDRQPITSTSTNQVALQEVSATPSTNLFATCSAPIGGEALFAGSVELIPPLPVAARSLRAAFFLDYGDVFSSSCNPDLYWVARCKTISSIASLDLSWSVGLSLTWVTAIGPLNFVFSWVPTPAPGDRTDNFYFNPRHSLLVRHGVSRRMQGK